jgi:hypothetical protein
MIEGSVAGSAPRTNGSRRPENIRIRIPNTGIDPKNHLEDVQTDPAALVNIGMVDGSGELNVGRPERIPEIKQFKILK